MSKTVSKDSYMLKYGTDRYKIQEICKKAISKDSFALN